MKHNFWVDKLVGNCKSVNTVMRCGSEFTKALCQKCNTKEYLSSTITCNPDRMEQRDSQDTSGVAMPKRNRHEKMTAPSATQ